MALRTIGSVATRVFPSPVFISAILPSCRTIPPTSCTSKCRMFNTLELASLVIAKESAKTSSKLCAPDKTLSFIALNASLSASSLRGLYFCSKSLILFTIFLYLFNSRSFEVPKIFPINACSICNLIVSGQKTPLKKFFLF